MTDEEHEMRYSNAKDEWNYSLSQNERNNAEDNNYWCDKRNIGVSNFGINLIFSLI